MAQNFESAYPTITGTPSPNGYRSMVGLRLARMTGAAHSSEHWMTVVWSGKVGSPTRLSMLPCRTLRLRWWHGCESRVCELSGKACYRVPQSLIHYPYRGRDASLTNALVGFHRPFFGPCPRPGPPPALGETTRVTARGRAESPPVAVPPATIPAAESALKESALGTSPNSFISCAIYTVYSIC